MLGESHSARGRHGYYHSQASGPQTPLLSGSSGLLSLQVKAVCHPSPVGIEDVDICGRGSSWGRSRSGPRQWHPKDRHFPPAAGTPYHCQVFGPLLQPETYPGAVRALPLPGQKLPCLPCRWRWGLSTSTAHPQRQEAGSLAPWSPGSPYLCQAGPRPVPLSPLAAQCQAGTRKPTPLEQPPP